MRQSFVAVVVMFFFATISTSANAQFLLTRTDPERNAVGVALGKSIVLEFSAALSAPTVSNAISIGSDLRGALAFSVNVTGNAVTITPSSPFIDAEKISIYLRTTLESTSGVELNSPVAFQFVTANGPSESTPPNFIESNRMSSPIEYGVAHSTAVDLDGDDDVDICFFGEKVGWLENDGAAHFTKHDLTTTMNIGPNEILPADLDLDGDVDLVLSSFYQGVSVYLNDGSQNFAPTFITPVNSVSALDIADFNADGLIDIVFSGRDQIAGDYIDGTWVLYNQTAGSFTRTKISTTRSYKPMAADLDNDGDPDIIQFNEAGLKYLQNTAAGFVASDLESTTQLIEVELVNVNNDEYIDLLVARGGIYAKIEFWINNGSFNFVKTEVNEPLGLMYSTHGDFDGDNDIDVIGIDGNYNFVMLSNDGAANFSKHIVSQSLSNFFSVTPTLSADFDNDSDLDFAILISNNIRYFENSTFPFSDVASEVKAVEGGDADWGDFDNDGDLDLITTGFADGSTRTEIFKNQNDQFVLYARLPIGVFYGSCDWGDFDNDGDLDVLIMGAQNGVVENREPVTCIYTNEDGVFTLLPSSLTQLPKTWHGKARWADMNNDGWLDIVINAMEAMSVYGSDGNGNFSKRSTLVNLFTHGNIDAGDYDLDGDLDLVISGWSGNDTNGALLRVFRNNGDWQFEDVPGDLVGRYGGNVHWNDMDNDGDLDLVVSGVIRLDWGAELASNTVYKNDLGIFTKIENADPLWYTDDEGATAVGDLNNDGITDLLASTWGGSSFAPELNLLINNGHGDLKRLSVELPKVPTRVLAIGDIDRDHDLDQFVGKSIVRNNVKVKNTPPNPPANLQVDSVYNNAVYLSWSSGSDINTPASGLSYQLYAGTHSKTQNIISANADLITGVRKLAEQGSLKQKRYVLHDITGGIYFFGVQSVDPSYEGSIFTSELQTSIVEIRGNKGGCLELNSTYSAIPSGNYTWEVTGGTIISGQGTGELVVNWSTVGKGFVKISDATGKKNTIEVMIDRVPIPSIEGDRTVCTGVTTYSVSDELTHSVEWILNPVHGINIKDPRIAEINWKVSADEELVARAYPEHKGCYVDISTNVAIDVLPTPQVFGDPNACKDQVKEYTTNTSTGEWEVVNGTIATQTTNMVQAKWTSPWLKGQVIIKEQSARSFCSGADTIKVEVYPTPPKPEISVYQDTILLSTTSPNGYYQWYFNDELIGSGPYQGVIPYVSGTFVVEVFSSEYNCGTKSDPFVFLVAGSGLSENAEDGLYIFPNPADRYVTFHLVHPDKGPCEVEIFAANGTLVTRTSYDSVTELFFSELDVSSLSGGIYIVCITTSAGRYRARLVKK